MKSQELKLRFTYSNLGWTTCYIWKLGWEDPILISSNMAIPKHPTELQSLNIIAHGFDEALHQRILQSWPGRRGMENLEMEFEDL